MAQLTQSFYRDANNIPVWTDGIITKKTITFLGGTTDAWGDDGGALDGAAVFSVTGMVYAKVIGYCRTSLTGAATLELGVAGSTALCLAQITDTTTLDAGHVYANATPATFKAVTDAVPPENIITTDIIATVTTTNITAGVIDFYCIWRPISDNASVTASAL